jgi:RNA polymerase sigma-70 factor (ECF subfamily)
MLGTPVSASEGARIAEPNKDTSLSSKHEKLARFEAVIVPHLDAAYNLARWLTRHEQNAEDVVQEAYLRAYQYFDRFQGEAGRAWLLRIVRNSCYTWLDHNKPHQAALPLNEEACEIASDSPDPESALDANVDRQFVENALAELAPDLREVIVLRELEQLSYKEIAVVTEVPMGTVMSRLSRGRQQLHQVLVKQLAGADDSRQPSLRPTPIAGMAARSANQSPGESRNAP